LDIREGFSIKNYIIPKVLYKACLKIYLYQIAVSQVETGKFFTNEHRESGINGISLIDGTKRFGNYSLYSERRKAIDSLLT